MPELMVVFGVIGLLTALLLPAVQQVRSAARQTECQNNLRQLVVAVHSYLSTHDSFPSTATYYTELRAGRYVRRLSHSPHGQLMAFIDPTVAERIDFAEVSPPVWSPQRPTHTGSASNQELLEMQIPVLQCPMDNAPAGGTNYRANLGVSYFLFDREPGARKGAFVNGRALRPTDFTDGLSTTAMFSERLVGDGNPNSYTPYRDVFGVGRQQPTTTALRGLCRNSATSNPADEYSFAGYSWLHGGWLHTWYTHISTPNARLPDCALGTGITDGGGGIFAPRSFHSGGVNVATADGAVRFVADGIDLNTWMAVGTRNGAEDRFGEW